MKAATKAKAVDDASDDPLESVESVEGALGCFHWIHFLNSFLSLSFL